jgi:hypothetical protein
VIKAAASVFIESLQWRVRRRFIASSTGITHRVGFR